MYIPRKLEDTILKYISSPEIIAIVGPRQSGKTTLLRHVYNKIAAKANFLTFEDNKILNLFVHDIDEFIRVHVAPYEYVFIDEFHYAKRGGKTLKFIIDTKPRKIFISGSSSIDLSIQAAKYLVGRVFVFSLYPLDFEEFLSFHSPDLYNFYKQNKLDLEQLAKEGWPPKETGDPAKIQDYYQEYAKYGGYPRVVTSADEEERKTILKNIYNTYFLREVKDILGLADDYKLSQMIKALALQIGNLIEYQEIAKVSELSYQTVKGYLNFLQKSFICNLIKPYFNNKRTEIVKNPKVYFFDTGLRNYIVDDFRGLSERPDGGALLENTLAMQLIKQERVFRYWRTKKKAEVDFIVDLPGGNKLALEVKTRVGESDIKSRSAAEFKRLHKEIPLRYCFYSENFRAKENSVFIGLI